MKTLHESNHNKIISTPCNSNHLKFLRVWTGNKSRIPFSKAFTIHKLYKKCLTSVWKSEEKIVTFASLIFLSKITLLRRKSQDQITIAPCKGSPDHQITISKTTMFDRIQGAHTCVCVTDCYFIVNVC